MCGRDVTFQLAVAVTAFLIALYSDGGGVFALNCVTCTNHDFKKTCYNLHSSTSPDYAVEECLNKTAEGLTAVCAKVISKECQAHVFADSKALTGAGKGELKRWKWMGCAYVDVNTEHYKKHGDCYWKRTRTGRDIEHKISGFKVVARSSVERTCYCDENECNKDADIGADVVYDTDPCHCGPVCKQSSRDECESPGFVANETHPTEPFVDDCLCPEVIDHEKLGERKFPDCGRDPSVWEPDKVGSGTYRHDGVDAEREAGSSGGVGGRGGGWAVGAAVAACRWGTAWN